MKTYIKIFAVSLVILSQNKIGLANPEADKHANVYFQMGYNQGLFYNGYVQVREGIYEGTHLRLKNDLGMSSWLSPVMTFGVNASDKNIFEFTYTRNYFRGEEYIPNPTWYNGVLYEPNSEATINKTIYRGFEGLWKARVFHNTNTNLYTRVAINYERLKFHVDAPVAETSPRAETYELFWRQQLPLPTLGMYLDHRISDRWSMNTEAYATYLPISKTWMKEGSTVSVQQSNVDVKLNVNYKIRFLSVSPGVWFKHYGVKEVSSEDENEFLLNGFGYRLSVGVSY